MRILRPPSRSVVSATARDGRRAPETSRSSPEPFSQAEDPLTSVASTSRLARRTDLWVCARPKALRRALALPRSQPLWVSGMLTEMGPKRSDILGAIALVGVLVLLMLVLVIWAIPPGGPPALQ